MRCCTCLEFFLRLSIEIYFHQENESKIRKKSRLCMTCIIDTTSTTKKKNK